MANNFPCKILSKIYGGILFQGGISSLIQAILQDPVTQQVLRDFQENPAAAQQAMNDPTVQAKIQKLIASGIIETR